MTDHQCHAELKQIEVASYIDLKILQIRSENSV